jgi:hypothetical protein
MIQGLFNKILQKEKKHNWLEISYSRFGTIIPIIDWDEEDETSDAFIQTLEQNEDVIQEVYDISIQAATEIQAAAEETPEIVETRSR